jgi:hypothetical protein
MTTIQALKTFLTAPESECKFSHLNAVFSDPKIRPDITFWGDRVITIQGEEGSVSLNKLADKAISIIGARCVSPKDWPSDTTPDKVEAKSIVDHLWKHYSQTNALIAHVNLFTWILAIIRGLGCTAARAYSDTIYLHCWDFKVGYKIQRAPFWGYDDIPAWAYDEEKPR